MSGHADPLKQVEHLSLPGITAERDALLAENQQLRDALERIHDEVPHYESTDRICPSCMAEVALAGDTE